MSSRYTPTIAIFFAAPAALAADPPVLRPGTRVRLHAGHATEIDGVLKFGSSSIDVRGHVVASTDKLVAVKTPERDTPLFLPRAGATLTGQFLALDDEGWTITLDGQKIAFQIPRDAVASVDISRGRHPGKDAGKGAVIGALAALLWEGALQPDGFGMTRGGCAIVFGSLGLVGGAVLGSLHHEHWEKAALPHPQVALCPQLRHGVSLSIAVRSERSGIVRGRGDRLSERQGGPHERLPGEREFVPDK